MGAALLVTYTAAGHASAVADRTWLALTADWLHLVAGTIWIGGLIQLVLGLFPALAALDTSERRAVLAGSIRRFSFLAGLSVVVLIATGIYAGLIHVPSWSALADTDYGAALSGKLILFVPLLVLGAFNLLILHPRFVRAARNRLDSTRKRQPKTASRARGEADEENDGVSGVRSFRAIVLGEIVLAILVLAVTGLLTGLPPATTAPGQAVPYTATQPAGDLQVTFSVDPNQAGENRLTLTIADAAGQPVDGAQAGVILSHLDMDMGQRQLIAGPLGGGRYQTSGNFIDMEGRWTAAVRVVRSGAPEVTTAFRFSSSGPADASSGPAFSPARILVNAMTPATLSGLFALLVAVLLFVRRRGWRRARDRRHAALLGAALALIGTLMTGSALAGAYRASQPNPFPPTPASLAQGQQIYGANCASCHGATGRGDGPASFSLRPRPADFRVHMADGHTDTQLFNWVARGVDGTSMPAFESTLSREEIWHVVNYIRTFAPGAPAGAP
jgi:copper transport protein